MCYMRGPAYYLCKNNGQFPLISSQGSNLGTKRYDTTFLMREMFDFLETELLTFCISGQNEQLLKNIAFSQYETDSSSRSQSSDA